ncbi:MAG: biotin--[acetyl-CoA-carboxylase] ligase [Acidobacteriota bacterium]
MANIKIPNILTDLAHVGNAGLLLGDTPALRPELELCRQWGYLVEQEEGRVFLRFNDDQIVPYWIQRETPNIAWEGLRVNGFLQIDSTNREALEQAGRGVPSGTLICAEEQMSGKGREDRDWYSPPRSGLYFSLIVRPKQPEKYWPILTHVASIALVRTLKYLIKIGTIPRDMDIQIKWPNDVLISGKKCAGILLQTLNRDENRAVIIGVGIDVHKGSVPEALANETICIDDAANAEVPRRKIMVGFLEQFQKVYSEFEKGEHEAVLDSWKTHSNMYNGVNVLIEEGGMQRSGVTCGLNEMGALLVLTEEGSIETIHAGSIRIQDPK